MRNVIAVMGLAFTVGTTCAAAGTLPIAARAVSTAHAPILGAIQFPPSPARSAAMAAVASISSPIGGSSRLHVGGQKWVAPQLRRSEAGVTWSLSPRVTVEFNYERSALAPTMLHDHDDGFLTRLRIGF